MSTTKIILAVLGAAAAGAVVANVISSGKGSELLDRLKNSAGDLLTMLTDQGKSALGGSDTAQQRAEFDQANTPAGNS